MAVGQQDTEEGNLGQAGLAARQHLVRRLFSYRLGAAQGREALRDVLQHLVGLAESAFEVLLENAGEHLVALGRGVEGGRAAVVDVAQDARREDQQQKREDDEQGAADARERRTSAARAFGFFCGGVEDCFQDTDYKVIRSSGRTDRIGRAAWAQAPFT